MAATGPRLIRQCPGKRSTVVAVTTGGLGDAILFSPVLKAARNLAGRVELIVASDLVRRVYEPAQEVDRVWVVDTNRRCDPRTWMRLLAVGARVRRETPPAVAVFAARMNAVLCRLVALACGALRIVMDPHPSEASTDLEVNLGLARRLGVEVGPDAVFVPVFAEEAVELEKRLARLGVRRFVAVYPSTPRPNRPQWPCRNLAEAAQRCTGPGVSVVVLGGRTEADQWRREVGDRPGFHVLAGDTDIRASAECLRRADLAICNDGGVMHLAGAVNSPLVGIMLNVSHHHHPPGRAAEVVHPAGLECFPCYPRRPRTCTDPAPCIDAVTVDAVVEAARRARRRAQTLRSPDDRGRLG